MTKILSKDIRNLPEGSVVEQIITVASLSYDRLPVMEVIFERFSMSLTPALKIYTSGTADVVMDSLQYMACGEALEGLTSPSFVALVRVGGGGQIGMVLDGELMYNNLEVMLGGTKAPQGRRDSRTFTMIEKRLGARFCEVVLQELAESMAHFTDTPLTIDSVEGNPRNAMLASFDTPCMKVNFRVSLGDRQGHMTFIIPSSAIEENPALSAANVLPGRQGDDKKTREIMAGALREADVRLTVVLCALKLPMSQILSLEPGQVIPLNIEVDEEVTVHCSNRTMFKASVGRKRSDHLAVKVTSDLIELPDDQFQRLRQMALSGPSTQI